LQDTGALDLKDVTTYVAGVSMGDPFWQINVRGERVGGAALEDGLPGLQGAGIPLVNMEFFQSLEVIKGPAGILYGSHSLGGLINRVKKMPLAERRTSVEFMYNTEGPAPKARGSFDLTGSIDQDKKLRYRLIGTFQDGRRFEGAPDERIGISPIIEYNISPTSKLWYAFRYSYFNTIEGGLSVLDQDFTPAPFLGKDNFFRNHETFPGKRDNWERFHELGMDSTFTGPLGNDWSLRLLARYVNAARDEFFFVPIGYEIFDVEGNSLGDHTEIDWETSPWHSVDITNWFARDRINTVDSYQGFIDLATNFSIGPSRHNLLLTAQAGSSRSTAFLRPWQFPETTDFYVRGRPDGFFRSTQY